MAIQTNVQKETLSTAYGTAATYGAVYTTAPGATAGTEPTGGAPAYARKALTWVPGASDGVNAASAVFDLPASTIVGYGVHTAVTGGTYLDGASFGSSIAFSVQGQLTVNFTYTQS